ncbi:MAG: phosphatase PAP2 family protein [Armatimonadota bacterium]|nr:phosphatase PAP2 family protein [Armatimonadota bacterium]MCX7777643.1 phosphatase PAP2 family protein [Armatimonadota bacterium]MDW8025889.1 phosphatase PAP2 family protein [Armatimonadota bacterium]
MGEKAAGDLGKGRFIVAIKIVLVFVFLLCSVTPFVEPIKEVDAKLLKLLNPDCEHKFADMLMLTVTHLGKNALFWLLLIVWLWCCKGFKRMAMALIAVLLVLSLTDLLTGRFMKDIWKRPRPALVEAGVRTIEPAGKSPSFPSAHAANWFAAARALSHFIPEGKPSLFVIASLVAYSRIYLGVHYPSDVIAGCIVGYAVASIVLLLGKLILMWIKRNALYRKCFCSFLARL